MTKINTARERTSAPSQLALLAGFYVACGLGITVAFHRLFTHTSFEISVLLCQHENTERSRTANARLLRWCMC